ncbi:5-formyltetrahydrofolate cyclo-ligase [Oceanicoccus sp. KOV_DT_Chl]|uniref:5-formyltetrahydrofolate cyclo-ligase n=1 Tax=Oceanicoccus sp. KOV_DT_Chl TaxID=1904639 RepID=UPI000C7A3B97|nr:5-formyltetrahydrofolate cyclo-ligase [Oceanicoccus sp. KOV_DT_Chl]
MSDQSRQQLRQQLRAQRRSLTTLQQQQAAQNLARNILASGILKRHRDIALYLANDGEIDPAPLLELLCQQGRNCFLPVIAPNKQLCFAPYQPGDPLKANRFGIGEPLDDCPRRKPWTMGIVFLPLVGFDRAGGRLGMGGGFYDRSFSQIKTQAGLRQPQLVGLAHHCQQVESLVLNSWDIPLSQIATDQEIISV